MVWAGNVCSRSVLADKVREDGICGGHIQRQWRLVDNSQPDQGFDIDIVWVCGQWVDEEDDRAQFLFSRQSTDLLITTQRTAQQPSDIKIFHGIRNAATGGSCAVQVQCAQRLLVALNPSNGVIFAVVVGNDRDGLRRQARHDLLRRDGLARSMTPIGHPRAVRFNQLVRHRPDLVEVQFRRCVRVQHGRVIDVLAIFGHERFYGHFLH